MEGILIRVDESIARYLISANNQQGTDYIIEVLDKNHMFVRADAVQKIEDFVKTMYDEMAKRVMERKRLDSTK